MATRKSRFAWLGYAVVALLAGCASSNEIASGRNPEVTVGQQLIDLQRVYDLGALSQQAYHRFYVDVRPRTWLIPG